MINWHTAQIFPLKAYLWAWPPYDRPVRVIATSKSLDGAKIDSHLIAHCSWLKIGQI